MTNEEMVVEIKNGNKSLINDLWTQNQGLVRLLTHKFYKYKSKRLIKLGLEESDLLQEAFFALLQAIEYYKEDSEFKFTTFFHYTLKRRLYDIAGCRSKKESLQLKALSLDAPIATGKDGDDLDLVEVIPDPYAEEAILAIDENDYSQKLHADLEKAIAELDEKPAYLIREHYFNNRPISSLATDFGQSQTTIVTMHKKALKQLKNKPSLSEYKYNRARAYLINRHSVAPIGDCARFKYTRTSLQERYVEKLEELKIQFGISK